MRLRRLKAPAFLPVATLWEDRFRSVLVERKGQALRAMAAYIDLNPVRAKICDDPKDYLWCGYAEAVAGAKEARDWGQFSHANILVKVVRRWGQC